MLPALKLAGTAGVQSAWTQAHALQQALGGSVQEWAPSVFGNGFKSLNRTYIMYTSTSLRVCVSSIQRGPWWNRRFHLSAQGYEKKGPPNLKNLLPDLYGLHPSFVSINIKTYFLV